MSKTKKTTPTKEAKKPRINKGIVTRLKRAFYVVLFAGNVANTIFHAILVSQPDMSMYVLAGFSAVSATYFVWQAIK